MLFMSRFQSKFLFSHLARNKTISSKVHNDLKTEKKGNLTWRLLIADSVDVPVIKKNENIHLTISFSNWDNYDNEKLSAV